MSIDFLTEICLIVSISVSIILFSYMVLPKSERIKIFFITNKKYISPNCISKWRMYGVIPTILLLYIGVNYNNSIMAIIAVCLFTFLASTDALDGQVARHCKQTSSNGAILDALADKFLDLPILFLLCIVPNLNYINLIIVIFIATLDITGQKIRGKNSPPEAGLAGKTKTTLKFITIYLMSLNGRYIDIYNTYDLKTIVFVLLIITSIFTVMSMAMKTRWYNSYLRNYLKDYL